MLIAIYGLGLIGGSMGRAILKNTSHEVIGYDKNPDSLLKAKLIGAISEEVNEENIKQADIVMFAMNPSDFFNCDREVLKKLKSGAVVMDCCGIKREISIEMQNLQKEFPSLLFIGAHPMAGREYSGISHSTSNLFDKAYIILCPENADLEILSGIKSLFIDIGFEDVVISTPKRHDEIIAYTSQLAHIISSAYIKSPTASSYLGFSAGSFRDMTRVAKLNPSMWAELMISNRDNLISEIGELKKHLNDFEDALKEADEKKLYSLLEEGNQKKEQYEKQRRERKND